LRCLSYAFLNQLAHKFGLAHFILLCGIGIMVV
jgi:hypothetical protein